MNLFVTPGDSQMSNVHRYLLIQLALTEWTGTMLQTYRNVSKRWLCRIAQLVSIVRHECCDVVARSSERIAQVVSELELISIRMGTASALLLQSGLYPRRACANVARISPATARTGIFESAGMTPSRSRQC